MLKRQLSLLIPSVLFVLPVTASQGPNACELTAHRAKKARRAELISELFANLANCANLSDPLEEAECYFEAFLEFNEGREEAQAQNEARLELCAQLGGDPYEPDLDPDDFVAGVDNPFFPLTPGVTLVYHADTEDGMEVIEVTTLDETREIMGIECVVVRDTVFLEGELIEDTFDYYAQDVVGNVWYMGEIAQNYEDGHLTDLGGSWIAGEDGGLAGILMLAAPTVGQTYRQEFLVLEAEDAGTVLALDAQVTVPFGNFTMCLQTRDFTPLEPDANEHKFYAAGIGPVLEIDVDSGERLELVDVITN